MKKTSKTTIISEGLSEILVYKIKKADKGPASKENFPFYNPSMQLNRDISIIVTQWLVNNSEKGINLLDGLAASGIRGIRFSTELEGNFEVIINDWDEKSYELIKKNINKSGKKNIRVEKQNLNTLLSQEKFHYIDIDPFGSPVYFIDSAMRSIQNLGIIACTATDTATLCGVYPKVCNRRYGAVPFHSNVMKEIGLRILIGYLCRAAAVYDKGIMPILCYTTDHYFRIYTRIISGVNNANKSIEKMQIIKKDNKIGYEKINKDIGPLWMGKLGNQRIIQELMTILFEKQLNTKNQVWKLFDLLGEESIAPVFFYTTDNLASNIKISPPKIITIFEKIKNKNYDIYRTHFANNGFKTNAPFNEIKKILG